MKYPISEIIRRSKKGRKGAYPEGEFGFVMYGGSPALEDLILIPPLFTPKRYEKMLELSREPYFSDVNTETIIGGFKVKFPLICASMGGTDIANSLMIPAARACAKLGIIFGIGENVGLVRGYDKRTTNQPCLKERIMVYLENIEGDYGGLVIQQSVEDETIKLWNKIYTDKDIEPFIERGLIAFEIKLGQGAKPGLGGETFVDRETALKLRDYFHFPDDPQTTNLKAYERHSAPGTFLEDILRAQIRGVRNMYHSRVKIFLKTGPYRDLESIIRIADEEGVDAVVIDGKEGGTALAPYISLKDMGYPTIRCLYEIYKAKKNGIKTSLILSGGLYYEGDLIKALCLGADGIAIGRGIIVSVLSSFPFSKFILKNAVINVNEEVKISKFYYFTAKIGKKLLPYIIEFFNPQRHLENYINSIIVGTKMGISALGKYDIKDLSKEDVASKNKDIAKIFDIEYI